MKLDDSDKEKLKKGQNISKNAEVSIKRSDIQQDLWPIMKGKDLENLWIFVNPRNKGLGINIQRTVVPDWSWSGVFYGSGAETRNLSCNAGDLIIGSGTEQRIYSINPRRTSRGYTEKDVSQHLKVDISLTKCNIEGKEVKCSLIKANE